MTQKQIYAPQNTIADLILFLYQDAAGFSDFVDLFGWNSEVNSIKSELQLLCK